MEQRHVGPDRRQEHDRVFCASGANGFSLTFQFGAVLLHVAADQAAAA